MTTHGCPANPCTICGRGFDLRTGEATVRPEPLFVVEFRNGGYYQGPEAENSGPLSSAQRITLAEAGKVAEQHMFSGPLIKPSPAPDSVTNLVPLANLTEAEKAVWRSAYGAAFAAVSGTMPNPLSEASRIAFAAVAAIRHRVAQEPLTDRVLREAMDL